VTRHGPAVAPRVYVAVFLGACIGGPARFAIDRAFNFDAWSWDIVAINVVGSALLGALMGWFAVHEAPWWVPGLGAGVLGGFTTFSAMAVPHPHAPIPGYVLLVGTLVVASFAAAVGWRVSESIALRHGATRPPVDMEEAEAEVEGFVGFEGNESSTDGIPGGEATS
jgi:CrcB protein